LSESIILTHNLADVNAKLDQLVTRLNRVKDAYKRVTTQVNRFNVATGRVGKSMHHQSRGFDKARKSARGYGLAVHQAGQNMGWMGRKDKKGYGNFYQFSEGFRNMKVQAQDFNKTMGISAGLWARFMAIGAARIAWVAGKTAIMKAAQLDAMRKAMDFSVGGVGRGGTETDRVEELSERYGLARMPATEGLTKLHAAMRGTSMTKRNAIDLYEGISKAVVTLGLSSEKSHGTFMAFEQIVSKGKVSAEELRRQLGDRIPGAFQIAARAMNMTTTELDKAIRSGNLLSEDFIPRIAKQLNEEFSEGAIRASTSIMSAWNRMNNTILKTADIFGKKLAPAVGILDESLRGLNSTIEDMGDLWKRVDDLTPDFVKNVRSQTWGRLYDFFGTGFKDAGHLKESQEGLGSDIGRYQSQYIRLRKYGYLGDAGAKKDKGVRQQRFIDQMEKKLVEEKESENQIRRSEKFHGRWSPDGTNAMMLSRSQERQTWYDRMIREASMSEEERKRLELEKNGGDMANVLGGGNRILNVTIGNIIEKNENNFTAGDPVAQEAESDAASDVVVRALISTLQDLGQM